jgi:pyruvate dehydrogenase E2 component (dihydrolipoyllysine-residue acetyltransferase)
MATDVTMPRLSDSMEEGTVLKWLVVEGGEVKRGEPLVEIETDKANMTYESDTDGTLIEVVAGEGDTLPIGEVIARVGDSSEASQDGGGGGETGGESEEQDSEAKADADDDEGADEQSEGDEAKSEGDGEGQPGGGEDDGDSAAAAASEEEREETGVATAEEEAEEDEDSRNGGAPERGDDGEAQRTSESGDGRVKASPVARRVAGERGVDLEGLEGTGPGGRIVKADVLAAAEGDGAQPATEEKEEAAEGEEEKGAAPEPKEPVAQGEAGPKGEVYVQELTRLQQTVSRRMAESKATAPDFTLEVEVDMTACVELRGRLKEVSDPAPSFNDMIVKACAVALREHPRVNGAYKDGKFELYEKVNIGVAVAAKDALVVPTLFDVGGKSLGEIARSARTAIEKVRDGSITPPELSGGTFTVSNLGMYGIERFSAVINPPQAALLTVGALAKKPVVDHSDRVVARDAVALSLVCDHRILYGADGAEFLARVREVLEGPLALTM